MQRNINAADLLRKALVVARKRKVTDIEAWLTNELNGYPEGATVPAYRYLRGELKVRSAPCSVFRGITSCIDTSERRCHMFFALIRAFYPNAQEGTYPVPAGARNSCRLTLATARRTSVSNSAENYAEEKRG